MGLNARLILWLAPRLMAGVAFWRRLRGQESARDLAERRGFHGPQGGLWLHGASNGELASARWLVEEIRAARPDLPILVTSSTVTGRSLVRSWDIAGLRVGLAPLESARVLRRFLADPPRAMVNLEGEFYPIRFGAVRAAGGEVLLLGARISARSHDFWAGVPGVARAMLAPVRLASAQDAASGRRLAALGVSPAAMTPVFDLKAEAVARLPVPDWPAREGRARVLLAASTHEGEEEAVLEAFSRSPGFDLLILAPRHPRRTEAVAALVQARGLTPSRHSQGQAPGRGAKSVHLADTMGEMDRWYAMAGACFVGGSLARKGGHTPWEPARHGAAILFGPDTANFAAAYARLEAAGAAVCVEDAAGLARTLDGLDGAAQDRMAQAARATLRQTAGAGLILDAVLSVLEPN